MPLTDANTKVKDPEYCNWLKVGLALYYLKVGLCSFIQGEVDAMHQSLLQKLYGASAVPASQCLSCNSKDVKQHRHLYTWKFRSCCPLSLCDNWLTELLAFHTNPTSSKLYCENCDVTAWPYASWECAKLYMPRGQLSTNTSPAQSDSQALLTLMANCKYFHNKLSQGGVHLIHMVSTIRNRVMHSGDMRLSDNDRKSFIQDIINLLEDPNHLKSLEECKQAVAEINKINNDSLDVFFNIDFEMKALSECVHDCRQELGVHKIATEKTVDSLKEELKNLKVQFDNSEKETKDNVTRLSRTVGNITSSLKNVKRRYSFIQKSVYYLKRKAVTDQRKKSKELKKLNEEIKLIKGSIFQGLRTAPGQGLREHIRLGLVHAKSDPVTGQSDSFCDVRSHCTNPQFLANLCEVMVPRAGWGARATRAVDLMREPVSIVFIHHTSTERCFSSSICIMEMKKIQNFHMDLNGWDDIGYSFVVGEDGKAYEARGWDRVGAHTRGWNDVSISIAVLGNFNHALPNESALKAINSLIECGLRDRKILPDYKLYGHRDASPIFDSPGNMLYNLIKSWPHYTNVLPVREKN